IYNDYGRHWNYDQAATQEFKFSSPANQKSKITWTAGAYLFYQKTPVRQSTIFGKDARQAGIPDSLFSIENISTGKSYSQALFGQLSVDIDTKTEFIIGLRFDHEGKELSVLFFFSSRRRHTRSVSAFLLNRSSDLGIPAEPDRKSGSAGKEC